MIQENILESIGRTPIVRLGKLSPQGVGLYAKIEAMNPGGSVKDRMALAIIQSAEKRGELRPGQMVVEATSGNTGISLAMVCAVRGYSFVAFMGDNFPVERRQIMAAYGAKVVLVPASLRASGRISAARDFAAANGAYFSCQYENPDNPVCHEVTTGAEILKAFDGRRLDWFVSGWGSGGTLTGVARAIHSARPETQVVAAEPENASLLQRKPWRGHDIPGWAPDFVPVVLEESVINQFVSVSDTEAKLTARRLAREEGILCGISGGGAVAAAIRIAERGSPGDVILTIIPDTGERYLSTLAVNADQPVSA